VDVRRHLHRRRDASYRTEQPARAGKSAVDTSTTTIVPTRNRRAGNCVSGAHHISREPQLAGASDPAGRIDPQRNERPDRPEQCTRPHDDHDGGAR
jgi:hypothetical protein